MWDSLQTGLFAYRWRSHLQRDVFQRATETPATHVHSVTSSTVTLYKQNSSLYVTPTDWSFMLSTTNWYENVNAQNSHRNSHESGWFICKNRCKWLELQHVSSPKHTAHKLQHCCVYASDVSTLWQVKTTVDVGRENTNCCRQLLTCRQQCLLTPRQQASTVQQRLHSWN